MARAIPTFVVLISALVLVAFIPNVATEVVDFEIVIEVAGSGAKLECLEGCAWKKLSFQCPEASVCRAVVDETGVRRLEGVEKSGASND